MRAAIGASTTVATISTSSTVGSARSRLITDSAWDILELVVTGAAFAFVGLQVRTVVQHQPSDVRVLISQAAVITGAVIVVRFLWIFLVASLDEKIRTRRQSAAEPVGWREMTIASWAGMRCVVTLATAPALSMEVPHRDRLVFIAFGVIIATLLLQGLTLPALVRRFGVQSPVEQCHHTERQLTGRARRAGLQRLEKLCATSHLDDHLIDQARDSAERSWDELLGGTDTGCGNPIHAQQAARLQQLHEEMLKAARTEILTARQESGTDPTVADRMLQRVDTQDIRS